MRALDTNVLVRFITNDDAGQVADVERIFAECHRNREHLYISAPVICELVWVLKNGLGQTKAEIVNVLDGLIEDDLFHLEHKPLIFRALEQYRHGRAGFTDYLIGQIGRHENCRDTVTFDKALRGTPGMTIL